MSTSFFQAFLIKYTVAKGVVLFLLPATLYIGTFYIHLTLLYKAGSNADVMTSAFQASLEVKISGRF